MIMLAHLALCLWITIAFATKTAPVYRDLAREIKHGAVPTYGGHHPSSSGCTCAFAGCNDTNHGTRKRMTMSARNNGKDRRRKIPLKKKTRAIGCRDCRGICSYMCTNCPDSPTVLLLQNRKLSAR